MRRRICLSSGCTPALRPDSKKRTGTLRTSPSFPSTSNQCALTALSQVSQSTLPQSGTPLTSRAPQSNFPRAFRILTSTYGDHAQEPLTAETIIEIIKLGDIFIRDDVESFIESFRLAWSQNGVWDRPPLIDPTRGGTIIENCSTGFVVLKYSSKALQWIL
ncbi:hypothetical protein GQ44DRAFT_705432 [Phaeosphaeriaceae sp. PMI808]|nr:hypothetical protein GQ44DRAFT_705432 [Phaeosphaeriaceae sp. PMI808]